MQMMKKRTNCYIYTRVSTSMQVDGYSLDAQREKLRGYAAYQEMTIVGEYSDEGFSGKNIQGRMEFRRILEDIQAQKDSVDYVLVFKLSRFGRNAADVLNSLQLMQDYGVNLICVEDGIDSSKVSGKLMISVLSAVAEIERENIRAQTMAATGHSCGFRFNLEQSKFDSLVASIISAMVNRPEFVEAIREKLGTAVDTSTIEKQIDTLKNSLRLASGIKSHLERQMDAMNPDDPLE